MQFFLKLSSFLAVLIFVTSCTKETSSEVTPTVATDLFIVTDASGGSTLDGSRESVNILYDKNEFPRGANKVAIAASALLPTTTSYLTTTYPGYTFTSAYTISNGLGVAKGYVVIISYNGYPVALRFNTTGGVFVSVLEQRQSGDVKGSDGHEGSGGHDGGMFGDRGHDGRDTISLTTLSASVKSYIKTTYPTDTLVKAFTLNNGNVVVITQNNGLYANTFTAAGVFVSSRILISSMHGIEVVVAQAALPATTLAYLTATYPNYVFTVAESVTLNGVLQGYEVVFTANFTKYALGFDATGAFVNVKVIR